MSVGSVLAQARIDAGLTIDDIAERTRIRHTLIENIEVDDFHACGGDFYARGHVKSIAQALHVDPAPLLAEFDGEHQDPDLPTASGVLDAAHIEGAHRSEVGRRPNWSVAMAVALVVIVGFGVFQLLGSRGGSGNGDVGAAGAQATQPVDGAASASASSGPSEQGMNPTPESTGGPSTAPTDAIAAVPGRGVTVVVTAVNGRSWVSASGKSAGALYQSVMNIGQAQTMSDDRQVKLIIGNAGAVRLLVNGHDLGSPGGTGEVVRLTFGPGDPSLATG